MLWLVQWIVLDLVPVEAPVLVRGMERSCSSREGGLAGVDRRALPLYSSMLAGEHDCYDVII